MKKKSNPKKLREQETNAQKAKYQAEAERKAEAGRRAEAERAAEEKRRAEAIERERQRRQMIVDREKTADFKDATKKERKSTAKAAGLKSTFILGEGHLLMTAFGPGNRALLEKDIQNRRVTDMREESAFSAVPDRERFLLNGRVPDASSDDPLYRALASRKTGNDQIHARAALEARCFNQTFEDNIHIQIIYNILDIEKLLSVYVNNIVYALTNISRGDVGDYQDLIDSLSLLTNDRDYFGFKKYCEGERSDLWERFQNLAHKRQLSYFNLRIFPEPQPGGKPGKKPEFAPGTLPLSEREFYILLATLGDLRRMLSHGDPRAAEYIYSAGERGNNARRAADELLDRLYSARIKDLNGDFLNRAQNDLVILFKIFGILETDEKARYVRKYYDFIVHKAYKYQGFSIKRLRETIVRIIPESVMLLDQKYDSVRQKVNRFFDFVLYRHYEDNPDRIGALVDALRACMDEESKQDIYNAEAHRVWPAVGNLVLKGAIPAIMGIRDIRPAPAVNADMLNGMLIDASASRFSELIYMLTLFLDGKEINILLTLLISKFENIGSLLDVLGAQGMKAEFAPDYRLFENAWRISGELRALNSFTRMTRPFPRAKRPLYIEAARVLREDSSPEDLEKYFDEVLDTGHGSGSRKEMGVRNFIANNVIDSAHFRYLARYADIETVGRLANSRQLVAFVLGEIPDVQIQRCYCAVMKDNNPKLSRDAMRQTLTDRLTGFGFQDLKDVRNNDHLMNQTQQREKRSKQALVQLYLTVLYLAIKNMVYVNNRYFLAFHCMERDRLLLYPEKWGNIRDRFSDEYGLGAFARDYLSQYPPRKLRVRNYIERNFANSDEYVVRAFRNNAEHLSAVRSASKYILEARDFHSWFELYHYIMQRTIMDQFIQDSSQGAGKDERVKVVDRERINPRMIEYAAPLVRYGTYCKDAVKAMCAPFAYNLARYRNLSIEGLFDKNHHRGKSCEDRVEIMGNGG